MPHRDDFYRWQDRVQEHFSTLKPHHQDTLARYSFGMVLAKCCGLTSVVAQLASLFGRALSSIRQALRELYLEASAQSGCARSELDHRDCFCPLLLWVAAGQPTKRLALALDPTHLGERFTVLCASVLYEGTGLPVAWEVRHADQDGSWNDVWADLLGRLKLALGEGWEVLVLTDRGLESAELFNAITKLGWHPLMRVKRSGTFRPEGWHHSHKVGKFAASEGRRWAGTGVAYPSGPKLRCTLLASWEEGREEAWLILTDLPPAGADVAWYAWRMWCEQGYRAIKRGQWGWHKTQMEDPARVARLWAVIALAMLWAVDVGKEAEAASLPEVPAGRSRPRKLSLLKQGLMALATALMRGEPMPMPSHRLAHQDWPKREWEADPLSEDQM